MAYNWIAKNQTALDIYLPDLGNIKVPASGQLELNIFQFDRVIYSQSLKDAIANNQILIDDGTGTLIKLDSDDSVNFFTKQQTLQNEVNMHLEQSEPKGCKTVADTTISFSNSNMLFSITPISSSFRYWIDGVRYIKTATDVVQITDTEGMWYIYYSGSILTASQTMWDLSNSIVPIVALYWDADNNKQILFLDERHGTAMDWSTHRRIHKIEGAKCEKGDFTIGNYILRGDGSLDAHAQFSLTNGKVYDEDLIFSVVNNASPVNPFEQKLSTIANIPLFYRSGTSSWRRVDATLFAVVYDGVNPIKYNLNTAGSWSLANLTNGNFVDTWIYATNDPNNPIIGIVGQSQRTTSTTPLSDYTSISTGLPFLEFVPLYKLTFKTLTTYANTPKAILFNVGVSEIVITGTGVDRYSFIASYGGNANTGRYLELFPGTSTDVLPFTFPENSFIRTMILQAAALATGTVSIYKLTDLATPVCSISLSNSVYQKDDFSSYFLPNEQIAFKVSAGTILKPSMMIWVQTDITT